MKQPQHMVEALQQVFSALWCWVIAHSHNPFPFPVLLVKKNNESWGFCVNYRQLNVITIKDQFHIPVVDDILDELQERSIFSKIDLKSGYH